MAVGTAGNLTAGAHLAALSVESGATVSPMGYSHRQEPMIT